MKFLFSLALAVFAVRQATAQLRPSDSHFVQSMSGQFTVVTPPRTFATFSPPLSSLDSDHSISLEANRLAVACERIREALETQIGRTGPWIGKIQIYLRPAGGPHETITIVSEKFSNGWNYRLNVPDRVERDQLLRAIVSVILLEVANRQAHTHSAELPVWLTEGLTQQLLSTATVDLIPPSQKTGANGPGMASTSFNGRMKDPLEGARTVLQEHPPLGLDQLSWPNDAQLDGSNALAYRSSAQLFVDELLQLQDGRASLLKMVKALPTCYNWQTAFFSAFGRQFPRQLDLEKWWALQVVSFTGRNPDHLWSPEASWQKLDEIIHTSVEIRQTQDELPATREADLRKLIQNVDYPSQRDVLNKKVRELEYARLCASPAFAELANDYRNTLVSYLRQRDQMAAAVSPAKGLNSTIGILLNGTLQTLNDLDARRAALRPKPALTNTAQAN